MLLSGFIESFFFSPDARRYWQPAHFGLAGREFLASRKGGYSIGGTFVEGKESSARGTALFFHAGLMNREFHLPQVAFLAQAGFDVALFDYSGFGDSPGTPTIDGLADDAEAALLWLETNHLLTGQLFLFAQGLGCDAALQLWGRSPESVSALVLESPYSDRRGWIKERWGPVVGDIAAYCLGTSAIEPHEAVARVKVPLLVIFPQEDHKQVHSRQKRAFLNAVPKQHTTVWHVPGKRFLGVFPGARSEWHDGLIAFLGDSLHSIKDGQ